MNMINTQQNAMIPNNNDMCERGIFSGCDRFFFQSRHKPFTMTSLLEEKKPVTRENGFLIMKAIQMMSLWGGFKTNA
jgi:hypothetical protein